MPPELRHPRPPELTRPEPRHPRATRWFLRGAATLHAVCVVIQPVFAGLYLNGDYDALAVHGLNGSVLPLSATLLGLATLTYLVAGGVAWPLLLVVVLWFVEGFQIGMGYARAMAIHIPLGVAIVGATVALAIWVWTPASGRGRR